MLDPMILRLVAITDDAEDRRATLADRVVAAVRGGATSIQVRLKTATPREVVEITRSIVERVSVPVIVNDRADIALAAGAAGVHVGEADLPVAAIRTFAPPNFIIGASLGSEAELPNARHADYVGIGPVYGSDSKNDAAPRDQRRAWAEALRSGTPPTRTKCSTNARAMGSMPRPCTTLTAMKQEYSSRVTNRRVRRREPSAHGTITSTRSWCEDSPGRTSRRCGVRVVATSA